MLEQALEAFPILAYKTESEDPFSIYKTFTASASMLA